MSLLKLNEVVAAGSKSRLNEWTQHQPYGHTVPHYQKQKQRGPAHAPVFTSTVTVRVASDRSQTWQGEGGTVKASEEAAAQAALDELTLAEPADPPQGTRGARHMSYPPFTVASATAAAQQELQPYGPVYMALRDPITQRFGAVCLVPGHGVAATEHASFLTSDEAEAHVAKCALQVFAIGALDDASEWDY